MAEENSDKAFESHPMTGGDGPDSYSKNSSMQRTLIDATKKLLNKAISENLEVKTSPPPNSFCITDLGCSTGPNTFHAVENIIEAVKSKYQSEGLNSHFPEFQAFFQDHTSNDFNILFQSLPENKRFYAAGVPGSFYDQMFPKASIDIAYSSVAIHWLSRVPPSVTDSNNPAWNKGRIHYSNSTDEVIRANETQHREDMESFLKARANEIVCGGLAVLVFPGRHDETSHFDASLNLSFQFLESCLLDLVRKGAISEEKVDSFNMPMYTMSPKELSGLVERNGCFSIEMVTDMSVAPADETNSNQKVLTTHVRAALQGLLKQHFGEEILDELFELYQKKREEQHLVWKSTEIFVVLKRKED